MTMPTLEEELANEYGSKVSVETVAPGDPNSPFRETPDPAASSPPAGEEEKPVPGAAPEVAAEETPPAAEAGVITPEAEEEELIAKLDEELAEFEKGVEERILEKVRSTEIPRIQSGLDRKIAELTEERETAKAQLAEVNKQIREQSIAALPEAEQTRIKEGWANEDRAKELDGLAKDLEAWHDELATAELVKVYVAYFDDPDQLVEDLLALDPAERESYCLRKENEYLRAHPEERGSPPSPNGKAAEQPPETPAETERRPAPAGSRAKSDAGGGGVPPTPAQRDEGKGTDAMAANIGSQGWESAPASFTRPTRG